ncbi:hypothetical protein ISN45_At03g035890 [Arabidopsis thaliana x Arabidopsis arenosa]|uniref:Uncharacterized protein n=1 Tax=Arabidopsis thaliana x Arabidopsis arenosa TaxID=1240361 RepID=A0A8T2EVJ6_9BRAS|nr:hypothetical protein ISN45_At03g035890 [Arabidopsis thaliana x Arabidopsis arenosa]
MGQHQKSPPVVTLGSLWVKAEGHEGGGIVRRLQEILRWSIHLW